MLCTMSDSHESKNLLARENIFLKNFITRDSDLLPAITVMICFWILNTLLLCVEFLKKLTPYGVE